MTPALQTGQERGLGGKQPAAPPAPNRANINVDHATVSFHAPCSVRTHGTQPPATHKAPALASKRLVPPPQLP